MKLLKTLKHEFLLVLPPTVFFFLAFMLIMATQRLVMREYGIPLTGFGAAALGALVIGKVVLVVDHLPFVNKFPDKPLVYNTAWKTLIYFSASLLVRYVEHAFPLLKEAGWRLAPANERLWGEIVWPHFWLVQMWLVVLFFVYCALRELILVIGRERFIEMFLGWPRRQEP